MKQKKMSPLHPGEVLAEEFLKPMSIGKSRLAKDIGVSPRVVREIIARKRGFTAEISLRLARYFNMSPQFWMGLQMDYELDIEHDRLAKRLDKEVRVYAAAA